MKQKIRWGVIGSGGIARRRTIPEGILRAGNAELAAVCSFNPRSNREVAREFNARACDSVAEAKRMLKACRQARVSFGTAFMMRYQSQHRAALRMIEAGEIGEAVYARAQLSCWYPILSGSWRQQPKLGGGGSLIDLGGHCLDLLEMFFGPIRKVNCAINRRIHKYKSEDSAVVLARFQNGALATVDACFCIPDNSSKNRLELYGSKGSILAQGTIGQGAAGEMTAFLENAGKGYDARQARAAAKGLVIAPPPVNLYQAEIEAFSQDLLDGRDTKDSALAGLRSQIVLAACYESARTGHEVKTG